MNFTKKTYLHSFTIIVLVLGLIKLMVFSPDKNPSKIDNPLSQISVKHDSVTDSRIYHPIFSVPNFSKTFPDSNDVQLVSANQWGVKPVVDNADAEKRKSELVYVGASPWFCVDNLKQSCPYLVPRAAALLQDIGKTFLDSLDIKGIPLHKIITTSVLRTKENVEKLRNKNGNATENSCHLYGTTFDICYNRYCTVEEPQGPSRRKVTNDTLKWVLSEVLRDMRETGKCHVKYEVKQGCFHITVK